LRDLREDILNRLLEVVAGIPGIVSSARNDVDIAEGRLPTVGVYDGDEESDGLNDIGSSRQPKRTYVVQLTPHVVIVEQKEAAGSQLSGFRREVIKRVLTDDPLIALVGTNGNIRYIGNQSDFGWGRSLQGAMAVQFTFKYPLKIEEL
jgi:hypothetical protein